MRIFRSIIFLVFILTLVAFLYFYIDGIRKTDYTYPQIKIDEEFIDVSLNADDKEMLKGVTAFDQKDGDITNKIVVESVSKFIQKGVSIVTYSVCDADNHVATATRKINYKNYHSPRFNINKALIFSTTENINLNEHIGVMDSIEGDISDNLIVTTEDYDVSKDGTYKISVQASNSKGDTIYLTLPVVVKKDWADEININLKNYLIYTKKGKDIDFKKQISSTTDQLGKDIKTDISIKTDFDKNKPGTYSVNYYAKGSNGISGQTMLMVIVEG